MASNAPDKAVYEETIEMEIQHHLRQTRLWRVANSAQWVAWGIVQAKISAMEEEEKLNAAKNDASVVTGDNTNNNHKLESVAEETTTPTETEHGDDDEFDYLAYAQDRALFFWGDVLSMGLIRENELPSELLDSVKKRMVNF